MLMLLISGLVVMPCNAEFRDPTQPAYPLPATAGTDANSTVDATSGIELVLSAIWISPHSKRAIINGINAKEGQTIELKQAHPLSPEPTIPANTASTPASPAKNKMEDLLNMANVGTNILSQGSSINPLGNMIAPLIATAAGSLDIPQLQQPSTMNTPTTTPQPAGLSQNPKTTRMPLRSTTIKIISIRKNSVTIEQNGELKTLQLVQRSYTTN
jgi:hypothetical protein